MIRKNRFTKNPRMPPDSRYGVAGETVVEHDLLPWQAASGRRTALMAAGLIAVSAPLTAQTFPVKDATLERIWTLGMDSSQTWSLAQTLTDSIGPRLTGSPLLKAGNDWLMREIRHYLKRVFKRLDVTPKSMMTLIEPGSCFAGTLAELLFASDRALMLIGRRDWVRAAVSMRSRA